jgi:hypothetical protein
MSNGEVGGRSAADGTEPRKGRGDVARRWSDLSRNQRRLVLVGAALEGVLKAAALADLRSRPAAQVRGPKWAWAAALVVVGSAGVLPLVYFLVGRRTAG